MKQDKGNLWTYPADARVITTNGYVKNNGSAVMGAGVAAEAANMFPYLPAVLGFDIERFGNKVFEYTVRLKHDDDETEEAYLLYTFPVKYNWWEKADLNLIEKSAGALMVEVHDSLKTIVMPRPGCGNGGLSWTDVKSVISSILDDRFIVLEYQK